MFYYDGLVFIKSYFWKGKKDSGFILLEVEREGYSAKVDQVFVPSENIVEMRDGKKRVRNKVFFPGYLLIKWIWIKKQSI